MPKIAFPMRTIITDHNRQRLGSILEEARRRGLADAALLMLLEEKLEWSTCVPPTEIPDDVVTMNSKVRLLDSRTNELRTCVLCYPDAIGRANESISVLDPIGCAILGCRAGDEIVVKQRHGQQRLQVVEVIY